MTGIYKTYDRVAQQINHDFIVLGNSSKFNDNDIKSAALRVFALGATIVTGVLLPITFSVSLASSIATSNPLPMILFFANVAAFGGSALAFYKLQPPKSTFVKVAENLRQAWDDPQEAMEKLSRKVDRKIEKFTKNPEKELNEIAGQVEKGVNGFGLQFNRFFDNFVKVLTE
jgi:hypothetical protein